MTMQQDLTHTYVVGRRFETAWYMFVMERVAIYLLGSPYLQCGQHTSAPIAYDDGVDRNLHASPSALYFFLVNPSLVSKSSDLNIMVSGEKCI
jgi:hypothetical protein